MPETVKQPQKQPQPQNTNQPQRPIRDKDFFVNLAKQPNARVIQSTVRDTLILSQIAPYFDKGLRRLREGVARTIKPEIALPLFEEVNKAIIDLHTITEKICKVCDVEYKKPDIVAEILEGISKVPSRRKK